MIECLFSTDNITVKLLDFDKQESIAGIEDETFNFDELEGMTIIIGKNNDIPGSKNGAGKSTLLRCLNCMEDPTGGSIIFGGEDIADPKVDINIHRQKMGMVFQSFNLFILSAILFRCSGFLSPSLVPTSWEGE